jgi:two-component system phosphate regulon sensor histidine kinase PhoR
MLFSDRRLWNLLPVGVIVTDAALHVVVCNEQAVRVLRLESLPSPGGLLSEYITHGEILHWVDRALHSRGAVSGALTLSPGSFLEVQIHALGEEGMLLLAQDVTELRHLRTVRRDFVANVSHELRTPLASIRLLVDTLENGALDDREVAGTFVHRIGVEADHLIQMVTELLELSRIESGQMPARGREQATVAELIDTAVERLSIVAQDKSITIGTQLEPQLPPVHVDRDQIVQVLLNLLFNAIKFTQPGGSVTVRASRDDRLVAVTVTDTGVGIAPDDLPRIFERFYKSDRSRARSGGGTGLGLPIARHIVEAHGGSIRAESQEGHGSAFTFTLPVL